MTNHFTIDFSLIKCLPIVKPNEPLIISGNYDHVALDRS